MEPDHKGRRIAIPCRHTNFAATATRDEQEMAELATRLGYSISNYVLIDPRREGPWATVANAIGRVLASADGDRLMMAVIVPDLGHIDGIDCLIRRKTQLITVDGEKVLERAAMLTERNQPNRCAEGPTT